MNNPSTNDQMDEGRRNAGYSALDLLSEALSLLDQQGFHLAAAYLDQARCVLVDELD